MKRQLLSGAIAITALTSCGGQENSTPAPGNTATQPPATTATPGGSNSMQIEDYTFRISNSVEGKRAHIDLYLTKGASNEHVSGASIELTLTAPDGHTETVNMTEDVQNKHYAGTATFDHTGEYQIAARTTVGGKTFTPRFTLTNTQ
jgi:hypothetical protein